LRGNKKPALRRFFIA